MDTGKFAACCQPVCPTYVAGTKHAQLTRYAAGLKVVRHNGFSHLQKARNNSALRSVAVSTNVGIVGYATNLMDDANHISCCSKRPPLVR